MFQTLLKVHMFSRHLDLKPQTDYLLSDSKELVQSSCFHTRIVRHSRKLTITTVRNGTYMPLAFISMVPTLRISQDSLCSTKSGDTTTAMALHNVSLPCFTSLSLSLVANDFPSLSTHSREAPDVFGIVSLFSNSY